jgi:hypothetical protein
MDGRVDPFMASAMNEVLRTGEKAEFGRPLTFDRDTVLRKAMLPFWRTGSEAKSIAGLTREMGIAAPSLYATLGDAQSHPLPAAPSC